MAKRKRKSAEIVDKAKIRLSAVQQIDTTLSRTVDYGGSGRPLTQAEMTAKISECESKNSLYNQALEMADAALNSVIDAEEELEAMHSQVLKGAVAEFGRDASEVEMLGGTRKSERRRPRRSAA